MYLHLYNHRSRMPSERKEPSHDDLAQDVEHVGEASTRLLCASGHVCLLTSCIFRRRHVKCDETPIACKNCHSAGWKCDGYDENRLPHLSGGSCTNKNITATIIRSEPSFSLHLNTTPLPGGNSNERRGFVYFQFWTVPKMSSFFDTHLWHNLVLPMSHSERAVTHAVIALGALHEDIEARGVPLSRAELTNHRQRFALEQYTRALSLLSSHRHVNDPKLRGVVLTCCLLFVMFELLRGLYDEAFVHLQQGLSLVKAFKEVDTQPQSPLVLESSKYIETALSDAMMRLHLQSGFFGADISDPQLTRSRIDDYQGFNSIIEAREELDIVFQPVSRFMDAVRQLASEPRPPDSNITRLDVTRMQVCLRIELARYLHRLNRFESRMQKSLDRKSQRAIDLIRLHHKTFSLVLETYIDIEDMTYDVHIDGFREMVLLSERITNSFDERSDPNNNSSRPTFLLDMGILPPLLYVCLTSPCVYTRRQALRCLRAWPHREGPWDSNLVALMGTITLQVEIEAEFKRLSTIKTIRKTKVSSVRDITYIPPPSRIICVNMTMDDNQKTAVLKYNTKERGSGMPQLERRVLVDEVSWI